MKILQNRVRSLCTNVGKEKKCKKLLVVVGNMCDWIYVLIDFCTRKQNTCIWLMLFFFLEKGNFIKQTHSQPPSTLMLLCLINIIILFSLTLSLSFVHTRLSPNVVLFVCEHRLKWHFELTLCVVLFNGITNKNMYLGFCCILNAKFTYGAGYLAMH